MRFIPKNSFIVREVVVNSQPKCKARINNMHIGWIGVLEALVGSVAKELHLQQTPKRNQNYYHQNTFLLLFFFENTFHFIYILVWLVLV